MSQTEKRRPHPQQKNPHRMTQTNQTLRARQTQARTIRKMTSFTRQEGATRAVQATAPTTMIRNTLTRTKARTKARTTPAQTRQNNRVTNPTTTAGCQEKLEV